MNSLLESAAFKLIQGLSLVLAKLPMQSALAAGKFCGLCAFYFSSRRHVAYADLKAAFGSRFSGRERWRIVRKHFAHMGQLGVEVIRSPSLDQAYVNQMVEIHHRERFDQAVAKGKGVVLLTAHLGNWELLHMVAGLLGQPMFVLARGQKQKRLDESMNQLRQKHGSVAVIRGMGIRELFRALKRKQLVGLLGDQDAGKDGGVIVPFFGRKTTVPTGAFEMARRSGAALLPCFDIRKPDGRHAIFVTEEIPCEGESGDAQALIPAVKVYLERLEQLITEHPEQWLWATKRWKHSWTKRILILSDGKPGHVKQSEAIAAQLSRLQAQYGRPGMEYPQETIEARFRSPWHRKLFPWFALIAMPWVQGRLGCLAWFFEKECAAKLLQARADFIISGGAALVPLNLCLARECRAKSIVMMRPGFPFNFFRYDLAVIPAHDNGRMPKETFRTLLAPNPLTRESLQADAAKLRAELRNAAGIRFALFLGGDTRQFKMNLAAIEKVITVLERVAARMGDYVITTSRRTPPEVVAFLKAQQYRWKGCQTMVVASEDTRPEVAGGMMALAEVLIVTEDSISMISEAIASGKKVVVLTLSTRDLPVKHQRFQNLLVQKAAVTSGSAEELENILLQSDRQTAGSEVLEAEQQALQRRLEAML